MKPFSALLCAALAFLPGSGATASGPEHLILLHGLARTSDSMKPLEAFMLRQGYTVWNIDYSSREHPIPELAEIVRKEIVQKTSPAVKVHAVTHSMGGIILRQIQKTRPLPNLGRVVMLSPPNQGSEVVDRIGDFPFFEWIHGPAGRQLGTDENSICRILGPVNFELGVITGDRSINWINSLMIPGLDDGKVSVDSAKVAGMADFLIVHATHPLIMADKTVMAQCLHFLRNGRFSPVITGRQTP